jgi:hypothetical protein
MPYFWVETTDGAGVAERLCEVERVEDVSVLDETESQSLLKVTWAEEPDDVLPVMSDTDAVALDVARETDTWVFRLQFPASDSLSTFNHRCRERGVEVSLERVYQSTGAGEPRDGLTPAQRELLATALEVGYFEVPRQTTLRETRGRPRHLRLRGLTAIAAWTLDVSRGQPPNWRERTDGVSRLFGGTDGNLAVVAGSDLPVGEVERDGDVTVAWSGGEDVRERVGVERLVEWRDDTRRVDILRCRDGPDDST